MMCAGLAPSLLGNALSWGLYWVAWKSIHTWWCEYTQVQELSWDMKLLTGMQAGACSSRETYLKQIQLLQHG